MRIKNISDIKELTKEVSDFTKYYNDYYKDYHLEDRELDEEISDYKKTEDKVYESSSDKFRRLLKLRRERLKSFNIKCTNTIKFTNEILDSLLLSNKEEGTYGFYINKKDNLVVFKKPLEINKNYYLSDEKIFSESSKAIGEFLINHNKGEDCLINNFNIRNIKKITNYLYLNIVVIALLYLIFSIGMMMKLKQINGDYADLRFIIIGLILSIFLIRIVPKIKKRKLLKLTRSSESRNLVSVIEGSDDFFMEIDYLLKLIHYSNDVCDLDDNNIECEMYDIISNYKNVLECNMIQGQIVDASNQYQKKVLSVLCRLELNKWIFDEEAINRENKKSSIRKGIKKTEEKVLLIIEKTNETPILIKEYKII